MNRIAAQRSRQRKKEKMMSLSDAVSRLSEENNRLTLENRCLVQTQSDQEQELSRTQDNTMLMQRYISMMNLSLQCVTAQLLLAKGEQPTEANVDLAALQLTRSVSSMIEQAEMQKLQEKRLQQQIEQQLRCQSSLQHDAKTQALQQPDKIHGQPQMLAQHNNVMQKLQLGSAQMFPAKPQGVGSTSKLTPLMQMQKQLHAHRMKTALSDLPSRMNSLGGAFGNMSRNLPPQLSSLAGFGAGSIGGNSSSIASLAGGMAAGLPMSSQMMNNMKYMGGMTGVRGRVNGSASSLPGMGGTLGTTQTGLSNLRQVGTGMGKSPAANMNNAMAGFPGMNGAKFAGLKDILGAPNTAQMPGAQMPGAQNMLQQTLFNQVRQKIQNQQQQQLQKQRQRKFQSTLSTLSGLSTPPLKRAKLESKLPITFTCGDLVPNKVTLDLTKSVPNLPERGPAPTTQSNSKPNSNPMTNTESRSSDYKLNAASTLSRMLGEHNHK